MKLLLVEDEESLRRPVKYFLERNNFTVDEAGDGVENQTDTKDYNYSD